MAYNRNYLNCKYNNEKNFYEELENVFRLCIDNKFYYLSKFFYGEYAEKICKQCLKYGDYSNNYYEKINNNYSNILIFSLSHGIIKTRIDNKNIKKLRKYIWRANLMQSSQSSNNLKYYIESTYGKIHRYILEDTLKNNKSLVVDHIDRDSLNNVENNLRLVTQNINIRNTSIRYDNTSGYKGIREIGKRWEVDIRINHKRYRKSFSFNSRLLKNKNISKETALKEAIKYRDNIYNKYGVFY